MKFFWWQNSQIFITYIASTISLDPIFRRNELYSELKQCQINFIESTNEINENSISHYIHYQLDILQS